MKVPLFRIVRWLFTIALLTLVALNVDWRQGAVVLGRLGPGTVALALLLVACYLVLKALKWHLLLTPLGLRAGFRHSLLSLIAGITMSIFTPLNIGELGRVFYLPGRSRSTLAGLVVVDKVLDFAAVLLFSLPGALLLLGPGAALMPALVALAALIFLLFGRGSIPILRRQRWLGRWRIKAVRAALGLARTGRVRVVALLPVALAVFFMVYLLYFVLLEALAGQVPVSLGGVMLIAPLVMAGRLIPLTVSGLGAREGIAVLLFPRIGISGEVAVELTVLVFLLTSALPALVGAFFRPRTRKGAGVGRAPALILLLALVLPFGAGGPARAQTDLISLKPAEKGNSIPAQFLPRFRLNSSLDDLLAGQRHWIDGERVEALACFESAAAREPDNHQALKLLGYARLEMGLHEEAREALLHSVDLFRSDAWCHRLLSRLYYEEGDLSGALKAAKEAAGRNWEEVSHLLWLARLQREAGKPARELKLYRRAVEVEPHNAELHHDLALLYEERGKRKEALAEYIQAKLRDPTRCEDTVRALELSAELGKPDEKQALLLEAALRCDREKLLRPRLEPFLPLAPPGLLAELEQAETEQTLDLPALIEEVKALAGEEAQDLPDAGETAEPPPVSPEPTEAPVSSEEPADTPPVPEGPASENETEQQ